MLDHGDTPFTWPAQARSAISLTADDGWPTQLEQARMLEAHGLRGTFYLSVNSVSAVVESIALWREVFLRGHEIGNHSHAHWSTAQLATTTVAEVAEDVRKMNRWLRTHLFDDQGTELTYAYPQGNTMIGRRWWSLIGRGACARAFAGALSGQVLGARTLGGGQNPPARVAARPFMVSGQSIWGDDETAFKRAKRVIDIGLAKGNWTVLVFHSLGDAGDGYSVSPAAYDRILAYVNEQQPALWAAPVVQVQRHILSRCAAA